MVMTPASRLHSPAKPHLRPGAARPFISLLVGLQLLLVIVVVAGALYSTYRLRQEALNDHLHHAVTQVRVTEDHLTQSLYLISLSLASIPDVIGFDNHGSHAAGNNTARYNAALEKMQRQMPALRSLSLAGQNGEIVASSTPANIGRHIDYAPLLPQMPAAEGGLPRIGVPWEGRDFHDGRPSHADRPVGARSNAFIPVVLALPGQTGLVAIAALNSDYFINHISRQIDAKLGHIAVFDYNGTLLLSTLEDRPPGARISDKKLLARILDQEIGAALDDRAHDMAVLTAFRASRNYPLFVVAHTSQATALTKWRDETFFMLSAIGLALAATLLITGVLTWRLRVSLVKEARMQEERRLAASVYAHSNDGILVTDGDTRILAVNPAFERITGYSAAAAIGQTPRLLSSGSHPIDYYQKMWQRLLETGTWQGEIVNRHKDGSLLNEWLTITRIHDTDGNVANYVGVFKDVSEIRRGEQTIRQLSVAVEQSPSSIVITTLEPAIEYINPHFTQVTGYTPDEVIGQNPRILQSKLTPAETYQAMWTRLLAGESWEGEFINRRKDGTIYHERATVAPIKDQAGQIVRFLAIKHDITEQKRLEQALIEAKDAAEASSHAKSAFLANMSHEIRTPMNGIIGMTQLALESGLKPEQADLVRKAHSAAVALLGILNDILDFSKIEAGKLEFESLPFDLDDVIDQLRNLFEVSARDKGLDFAVLCDDSVPRYLIGDPLRLSQVLTNLIGNAIKFTHAGRVGLHVGIADATGPDSEAVSILFEVADTGIGMSSEQIGRLFHAFQQGDNSITREYGGTGLGLAISHRLVTLMGSRIDVESVPGAGSRFRFTAGFKRTSAPPAAYRRSLRGQHANLEGLAVLLVEDNALNQQLARTFLERVGITVTIAENGAAALACLAPDNPVFDVVLMDIQMPVMDGLTATRHIRADSRHTHLPIIATTAHAMAEDRAECLASGMQDYLTKPINISQLYAKIARWTGRQGNLFEPDTCKPADTALSDTGSRTASPPSADHALAERAIAIERIGGNEAIYREVIASFLDDQVGTADKLRTRLVAADIATAHRIAHTLKGTAATIGASSLFEAACALDRDLKAGAIPDDWPARMNLLEARLGATLAAIRAELSSSSGD